MTRGGLTCSPCSRNCRQTPSTISGVGKHSLANVATHPTATLVWPPASPDGYSLIVDGTAATGSRDGEIVVTPTKAILHRPAVDAEGKRTGSDCAPV